MKKSLVIIGYGHHAEVVYEIARLNGYQTIGYVEVEEKTTELPYLGCDKDFLMHQSNYEGVEIILAVGDLSIREKMIELYREHYRFANLIHPSCIISESAVMGYGNVVMAGAILNPKVVIGNHCILNTGCVIEHHTAIGNNVHVAPKSALGGDVRLENNIFVGLGSSIKNGVQIGSHAIIGMGSVVLKDIPTNSVYVGNPARIIRRGDF